MHRTLGTIVSATLIGGLVGTAALGSSVAVAAAPVAHCPSAALHVSVRDGGAGLSHRGYLLVFTNVSHHSCSLTGYPHVFVDNAARRPVLGAARTPAGYLGGLAEGQKAKTVTLAPKASASAMLEGVAIVPSGDSCPVRPLLSVTAPQTFTAKVLRVSTGVCTDVEVHPIVAGVPVQ